ncbi:exported hypothetical protein [Bradyrhizobium sp. STM 3843]|uniref:hypothetical protein n=1 Tax=Bradyrhizobium sp. STM 3843 TaxID=551947 RepID=UPI0002403A22|nr:hypothetical protein [Bradyrhizobium sp. STM 3843]CCE08485.1 exported hypothetical protein [Bradyrhizobium sp. STM 3843]
MTGRQKVKLLVVVWGDRYVREFSQIALPALLASGNLPVLAQETDLEVLIMTQRGSVPFFDREPAYGALCALCPVRFIFIDDLIPGGNFGITLTLAYARGIRDSGEDQTSTYFIFMNADFVVANGSLRTLYKKIQDGAAVVFAPSLRVCSEPTVSVLLDAVSSATNRLEMGPREMVRLALNHLHPTVIAKTITQSLIRCNEYNHLYWQVDRSTLLARNYLIFVPMIKPERPMPPVNSYSDYGFVPELVPSGRMTVLEDSDDFFMLELQRTAQESQRLRCGRPSQAKIAAELSRWTTREHRFVAERDFVFHSGELPANLPEVRAQAVAYMKALCTLMSPRPVSHLDHPYWTVWFNAWLKARPPTQRVIAELGGLPQDQLQSLAPKSEEAAKAEPSNTFQSSLIDRLRRHFGKASKVPIWRHNWLDIRLVLNWLDGLGERRQRSCLMLYNTGSFLARPDPQLASFNHAELDTFLDLQARGQGSSSARYGNVLLHVVDSSLRSVRTIFEQISSRFDEDVEIAIYAENWNLGSTSHDLSGELPIIIQDFLPGEWLDFEVTATFAGGRIKRWLRRVEVRLLDRLVSTNAKRALVLPFLAGLLSIVWGLTAINNWRLRRKLSACPEYCSSFLVRLRRGTSPRTTSSCASPQSAAIRHQAFAELPSPRANAAQTAP